MDEIEDVKTYVQSTVSWKVRGTPVSLDDSEGFFLSV